MGNIRLALLPGLAAIVFQSCSLMQGDRWVQCGKEHHLEVVSLAIYPDPLPENKRIEQWRARVRSDASAECQAVLQILETGKNEPVTGKKVLFATPGTSDVLLNTIEGYRFSGKEHCFEVVTEIDGTKRPIDVARPYCARLIDGRWWSMR